jgi:C-terminal processing protease CtpA/Prc
VGSWENGVMATARWVVTCAVLLITTPRPHLAQVVALDALWRYVAENYAYLDQKALAWSSIPQLYADDLTAIRTTQDFVGVLERIVEELYDHHAHLTTNTATSPRLVPSGADIWAVWENGQARVLEVRAGSDAERAGIRAGAGVVTINGVPIATAIDVRVGRALSRPDDAARSWALRMLLAGRRNQPRVIGFTRNALSMSVELPLREQQSARDGRLAFRTLQGNRGYIRMHDSLGDSAVIADFDKALAALRRTSALILDLRDTPGGGNSTVARAILGRFVNRERPYQKHVLPSVAPDTGIARSWLELVTPRGPFQYERPVAVLVNHWTGSMGEGLAIGFDATRAGVVVGTPMAGLLGATYRFELPHSRIGVNVPVEQLFHVDGTPRERFVPPIAVDPSAPATDDAWIAKALQTLDRH